MKKQLLSLACLSLFAFPAHAAVRSLYRDGADLFLHEKIGKTENLLDNPARLSGMKHAVLEDNFDVQVQNSQPHDPVYEKQNRSEVYWNTVEAMVPVESLATLNLGSGYASTLISSEVKSRLDDARINHADKTFSREIHAGAGTAGLPSAALGYAFAYQERQRFVDFASDIASEYAYANHHQTVRHGLGLSAEWLELYGSFSTESYRADYNQTREVDFATRKLQIQARKLFGEPDQGNVLLKGQYVDERLEQNLFVLGREGFDLDVPGTLASAAGYWYLPGENLEIALGAEGECRQREIFTVSDYAWTSYQTAQGSLLAEARAQILPGCWAWLETDLIYRQDSLEGSRGVSWQNRFGVQFSVNAVEVEVYALPQFSFIAADKTDAAQGVRMGMTAAARF